ncbi:dCMP phosphohydrolase [Vibrio crassostreae]|nr:dCMP phosphohydrolase [Vibrio crassostreae]CAK2549287.1 dCMP phosphohydrolase [Vibrio crassostreae]CAK2861932.1 dCMP phosphohydrolase [Vibrio crassostreae]CAK3418154.1 dCMP phosphohydrolase [Vibrio crassostreae]CAK3703807.1 dCMP phosphohydrolase [Vibrio crassostreae]
MSRFSLSNMVLTHYLTSILHSFTSLGHQMLKRTNQDLPTPVKYYNPDIAQEYKKIEAAAEHRLLSMLPEEFRDDFAPFLISGTASKEEQSIVKQADTICAYLKCLEELSAGNHEYEQAKRRLEETLEQRKSPEMDYFLTTFAPSFELSLDEIS